MQILLDSFDVRGVVHYGIAGSADDSLSLGDVSVPSFLAFTTSWKWKVTKQFLYLKKKFELLLFNISNLPRALVLLRSYIGIQVQ